MIIFVQFLSWIPEVPGSVFDCRSYPKSLHSPETFSPFHITLLCRPFFSFDTKLTPAIDAEPLK